MRSAGCCLSLIENKFTTIKVLVKTLSIAPSFELKLNFKE